MLVREVDARELWRLLEPVFAADEVRHTVPMGIAATLVETPERYPNHKLWVAESDGRARAALIRTLPFHAWVLGEREALERLAVAVSTGGIELPGVSGTLPEATWFADAWCARTAALPHVKMRERLLSTTEVESVPVVSGRMRPAGSADRPMLVEWYQAFAEEAGVHSGQDQARAGIDAALRIEHGATVWDDDGPVALSIARKTSLTCARIGPVFTPPEHRRRGYATALVAAHSRALLSGSTTTCLLFADVANPTSNSIYQRIGYRAVCEAVEIELRMGC